MTFLAALASPALAQGYSIDFEFVRPGLGDRALPGLGVPSVDEPGTVRLGGLVQYERAPVTLFDPIARVDRGAIVANHGGLALGASIDATTWLAVDLVLPMGVHWATELPELAGDGPGLADAGATVRAVSPALGPARLGARLGGTIPTGRQLAWLGEESPDLQAGLLAMVERGPVRVATDVGLTFREDTPTGAGFVQGDEVSLRLGGRVGSEQIAGLLVLFGRAGFPAFLSGGAENSAEALAGVALAPVDTVHVDLGLGRGLTEGYGTTDVRVLAQATWTYRRPEPPPPEVVEVPVYVERVVEKVVEVPAPPAPVPGWGASELARVEDDQIVIRDMLQFVVDTNVLLDVSRPTLQAVADIVKGDGRIGHLAIVGHASQEGSHRHNYDLSESRAQRIYELLLELGVHPARLSYRAMGEVVTLQAGEDEASLQPNRRVEFRIVRQDPPGQVPAYDDVITLPWSGEQIPASQPPVPVESESP